SEKLVEAVHRRQKFVFIAKVVFAELTGGVTHSFKRGSNGNCLRGYPCGRTGLADRGHAGADRKLTGDEVGAARRTTRLRVVIGEQHAFGGDLVEVRRPAGHQAAVVRADIPHANIVTHDDDDVRTLSGRCGCRWLLLRLRGGRQSDARECCRCDKRAAAQQEIAAFQSSAILRDAIHWLSKFLVLTHDALLFLVMPLKPTWLAEVSTGSAWR